MINLETKKILENLLFKFKSIEDYDKQKTFEEFIKPLFEVLEWDFDVDVIKLTDESEHEVDYAFQINNVTRFYLSIIKRIST